MRATDRNAQRKVRHHRARAKLAGTSERPRLAVYRSLNHIYAQLVDDATGRTLAAASTLTADVKGQVKHGGNKDAAAKVGAALAAKASAAGIKRVCFDRAGFRYHGCVAELAAAARKAGLEF